MDGNIWPLVDNVNEACSVHTETSVEGHTGNTQSCITLHIITHGSSTWYWVINKCRLTDIESNYLWHPAIHMLRMWVEHSFNIQHMLYMHLRWYGLCGDTNIVSCSRDKIASYPEELGTDSTYHFLIGSRHRLLPVATSSPRVTQNVSFLPSTVRSVKYTVLLKEVARPQRLHCVYMYGMVPVPCRSIGRSIKAGFLDHVTSTVAMATGGQFKETD